MNRTITFVLVFIAGMFFQLWTNTLGWLWRLVSSIWSWFWLPRTLEMSIGQILAILIVAGLIVLAWNMFSNRNNTNGGVA